MLGDSERAPRREGSREGTSRVSVGGGAELVLLRAGSVGRTDLPRDGGLDSAAWFSRLGAPSKTSKGIVWGTGPVRIWICAVLYESHLGGSQPKQVKQGEGRLRPTRRTSNQANDT